MAKPCADEALVIVPGLGDDLQPGHARPGLEVEKEGSLRAD